jgi:hypothetical protein
LAEDLWAGHVAETKANSCLAEQPNLSLSGRSAGGWVFVHALLLEGEELSSNPLYLHFNELE